MPIDYYINWFESLGDFIPGRRFMYPPGTLVFPEDLGFEFIEDKEFPSLTFQKGEILSLMKDWRYGHTVFDNAIKNLPYIHNGLLKLNPVFFVNYEYVVNKKKKYGNDEYEPVDIVNTWATLVKLYHLTLPKRRPEGPFLLEKLNIKIQTTPIVAAMAIYGIPFRNIIHFLADENVKYLLTVKQNAKTYFKSENDPKLKFKYQLKKAINTEADPYKKHLLTTLDAFNNIANELYKFNDFRYRVIDGNLGSSIDKLCNTFDYFIPPDSELRKRLDNPEE